MKHLLQYTALAFLLCLLAAPDLRAQNSGFINQDDGRYKWNITGEINAPLTGVQAIIPNPSRDMVDIVLTETAYQPVDVWIIDFNGTILKSYHFQPQGNQLSIDISTLPRGQYGLQVKEAGKEVQRMMLVRGE